MDDLHGGEGQSSVSPSPTDLDLRIWTYGFELTDCRLSLVKPRWVNLFFFFAFPNQAKVHCSLVGVRNIHVPRVTDTTTK